MANKTEYEEFFKDDKLNEGFLKKYDEYFVKFLKAIHKNDNEKLKELLLENGAASKVNSGHSNETLLHIAVRFGSTSLVNNIIELGTDINAQNSDKETPLYRAIDRSAEMVKILLSNGAKVNISDIFEETPLQRSFLTGSIETVQLLLDKTYAIKLDTNQETSDFVKCRKIVETCLKLLCMNNINWKKYSVLLHFAGKYGDEETFQLVFDKSKDIDINAKNSENQTILHVLAAADRLNLMTMVLKKECNVNQFDSMKRTPLFYAIMAKNPKTVGLLLKKGADIYHKDCNDIVPFSYALRYENKEIVTMLLESGYKINETRYSSDIYLFTPFHEAIGFNQPTILKKATEKKIQYYSYHEIFSFEDWRGCSLEMINLLIARGANVKPNSDEFNPLAIACLVGRFDIVKLLLAHNVPMPKNAINYAVEGNNIDLVDFLMEKGFNVNHKYKHDPKLNFDETPLSYIIKLRRKQQYVEMIEYLVDNKASFENDSFIEAIGHLKPEEVVCLLELKLTFKITNGNMNAAKYRCNDYMSVLQATAFFALQKDNIQYKINYFNKIFVDIDFNYNYLNRSAGKNSERPYVQDLNSFYQACKFEIKEMKLRTICEDSSMTYFDFLSRELKDLVQREREGETQVLNTGEYKKKFPCYAFLLEQRIKRVENLKSCLGKIENYYDSEVAKQNVPFDVLDKIYSNWSVADIRNFARSLSRKM